MSVNYECVIMYGWKIPTELQEIINEITEYKYEDNWWYPDSYCGGYSEDVFLGEYITGIPLGTAMALSELNELMAKKSISIDNQFAFDEVRLELANNLECFEYVKEAPIIYIVNSVF